MQPQSIMCRHACGICHQVLTHHPNYACPDDLPRTSGTPCSPVRPELDIFATPAEVARLCGVDESDVRELFHRRFGLDGYVPRADLWGYLLLRVETQDRLVSSVEDEMAARWERAIVRHRKAPSRTTRQRVIQRDGLLCRYCGRRVTQQTLHLDHVISASARGRNTPDNLVVACRRCNIRKGSGTHWEQGMRLRAPRGDVTAAPDIPVEVVADQLYFGEYASERK